MINRLFWNILCFALPWMVLLIHDNPGGAIAALVMQASLIGWIPATLWAMRTVKEARTVAPKPGAAKKD